MPNLYESLVRKNAICKDTEVVIEATSGPLSISITETNVSESSDHTGEVIIYGISTLDGRKCKAVASSILLIDGMKVERIMSLYGINADGSFINNGKKRGRKPKNVIESDNKAMSK